ncbi:hypothetical protein [Notoacmeibacter sp. MSK16QG-6]|uniref:hypothetical protein n=1 Tax=Notoacmeibacter sp. MSK16QG-6 TaxID=2957982 RepID=UPI00209EA84A|nr:hypothetical protein [Notoacmeibacter sp. MSK16QG-6]MCP1198070.1 hypothetical protein [Notoacmeibacter sp. MSK16QG-6]
MNRKRTNLQKDKHFPGLRFLQDISEMSQRDLAGMAIITVSVGGINCVLNSLIEKVLVELGNFIAAEDKHRYAYILTPKDIAQKAALTRGFLAQKIEDYEALKKRSRR